MTKERAKQLAEVMLAYSCGEQIECRNLSASFSREWHTPQEPNFSTELEWRIKPAPLEFWLGMCPDEHPEWKIITGTPSPMCPHCRIIKVREVV